MSKNKDFTIINVSSETHKKIKELAEKEKRTIRSMMDIIVDNYKKGNK
ncbi:MAG: hypothetical protein ACEQSQ_11975 [Candidatus Paceibacteria bacterium]